MGIFSLYYNGDDSKKRYENEIEYQRDLFAFLDMCLSFACAYRLQDEEGKRMLAFKAGTSSGFARTEEEAIQYLQFEKARWDCDKSGSQVRQELLLAKAHMMSRLTFTPQRGEGFWIKQIFSKFELSHVERFLLLLSMSCYWDVKYESIFSYLQGSQKTGPTLRLAFSLYDMFSEVTEEEKGKLIQLKGNLFEYLVVGDMKHSGVPTARMFFMSKRIYTYMLERRFLNSDLESMVSVFCRDEELQPAYVRKELLDKLHCFMEHYADQKTKTCNVLHLYGEMGNGKRFAIKHAAKSCGWNVLFMDVSKLIESNAQEIMFTFQALKLECRLSKAVVCFIETAYKEEEDGEAAVRPFPPALRYLLELITEKLNFCFWISEEKAGYLTEYPLHFMALEFKMLTVKERIILWQEFSKAYRLNQDVDLVLCANQYILTVSGIQEALHTAEMVQFSEGREELLMSDILSAVKQRSANQLGRYATLINGVFTWDDLILDEAQKRQMQMICNQVRYRDVVGEEWGFYRKSPYGNGICAMFYGSPGTGKTMAVQVMANELGLDLYRIDLSQMVSKYIGETQKNISALFQKAKNVNALLFFDEADSLFAKRSEVKDSNDRNANGETAHLLQKLEDYSGITILATNYANNIDDAFKRRIKFMVDFVFPKEDVRYKLWTTIIPDKVKCDEEIDFEFFAKNFELSGSNIKEILTNAAYIAASEHRGLANQHIVEAIKLNFAKYGKILTADNFGYLG